MGKLRIILCVTLVVASLIVIRLLSASFIPGNGNAQAVSDCNSNNYKSINWMDVDSRDWLLIPTMDESLGNNFCQIDVPGNLGKIDTFEFCKVSWDAGWSDVEVNTWLDLGIKVMKDSKTDMACSNQNNFYQNNGMSGILH